MSSEVTFETIQEPDGSDMIKGRRRKMDGEGVLLGAAGAEVRQLQRVEREQRDRRARASIMSAATCPPIYNPRFEHGEVGRWDRLHAHVPLPRNKCARTFVVTARGSATGPRTLQ